MIPRRSPWHAVGAASLAGLALVLAGCSSGGAEPLATATPTASATARIPRPPLTTVDYLPGRAADVRMPEGATGSAPVVVLIPGGSWQTADRSGLTALAEALTATGAVTVNATYRALAEGVRFPETVDDVACAVRFAVDRARATGVEPSSVTLLGHSAGGHLAALAALGGEEFGASCPYPAARVDSLIGVSGVYDTATLEWAVGSFVGTSEKEDSQLWRRADPVGRLRDGGRADDLRVLLVHAGADEVVPVSQSRSFQAALDDAGASVRLVVVPGATHTAVIDPAASGAAISDFVGSLPAAASPS